ncbi:ABC transporter permease [Lactococcus lactis]|uniref:ABC transporter permease n=1 Tax=Lactococcus lactis TaxID=1358 RepID=A0A552YYY4_9LACT|nr:ABC transporter permease [Lactococcus lactis]MCC4121846.1 ABC transporter permease [Lactococcus lactis]MCT0449412.1 ABC transporter permease [Lactococcus lactis subsp. lactis]MCT1179826.1 ABC transporter permease [Lactococcus lactis]TRW72445.1 ABC transporter permease [Lactococcus lactis]WDA68245.1 ABC transporter permease [Lactococcus lactis]
MKITLIKELFYLTKSKIYLVIFGIIIGLLILGTFQASLNLKGAESLFMEDKQSDINFQKNIHKDYSISNNGNQSILNNATRYDYEQLNQANQAISFVGFPQFIFKSYGMTIISLLAGFFGVLVANYDYKFGTFKRRLGQQSWKIILLGKSVGLVVSLIVMYLLIFSLAACSGEILHLFFKSENAGEYGQSLYPLINSDSFYLLFFSFMIGLALAMMCFALTLASKRANLIGSAFMIYLFILPNTGCFDWSNMTLNIFAPFGNHLGVPPLSMTQISPLFILVLFVTYLLIILTGGMLIFFKHTRYNI